mmetsp:Transcript_11019/g.37423  ORF Transcript_11019/g.37423 Transcript_11019/m.37423 type:complete len:215 (+) Transcript_11019:362-1006(+)
MVVLVCLVLMRTTRLPANETLLPSSKNSFDRSNTFPIPSLLSVLRPDDMKSHEGLDVSPDQQRGRRRSRRNRAERVGWLRVRHLLVTSVSYDCFEQHTMNRLLPPAGHDHEFDIYKLLDLSLVPSSSLPASLPSPPTRLHVARMLKVRIYFQHPPPHVASSVSSLQSFITNQTACTNLSFFHSESCLLPKSPPSRSTTDIPTAAAAAAADSVAA